MTAVEWFMEKIGEKQSNGFYVIDTLQDVQNVFQQAKEMEKQQIIDAMDVTQRTDFYVKYEGSEHYYNETFKTKQQ